MNAQILEIRNLATLEDAAYDRWQLHKGLDKRQRFSIMSNLEKVAVLFGDLNCQVCNGGFQQWITNGYGNKSSLRGLRRVLEGTHPLNPLAHDTLLELLDQAEPAIERWENENGHLDEQEWEDFSSQLDTLDSRYYAIEKQLEAFYQAVLDAYDAQRDPFTVY